MTKTDQQYKDNPPTGFAALADETGSGTDRELRIINALALGVLVFDRELRLKLANTVAAGDLARLSGTDNEPEFWLDRSIEQVFPEQAFPGWAEILSGQDGLFTSARSTSLIARCDNTERVFNVTVSRIQTSDESNAMLVITMDDVTEKAESDTRLFQIEKSSDKGVMAAHIAHDLNNFLGLVLGGVEIAQMSMAKGNREKADRSLEKIKSNVGRLEEFTRKLEQLTAFEKSEREADFNRIIARTLSYVAAQKKFKCLTMQAKFDYTIPAFAMDPAQIEQLLLNILNNAADAVVETGRSDGTIIARTWLENDCACLSITDNGIGIKPEIKGRLFRSHLTTKPDNYGYGLVTCARIIDNHQADFEIESEPGNGATFTFRFPLHPEPELTDSGS